MSLDGNFAGVPVTNQACSGGDSGNAWRGHYDDNSATSFNRWWQKSSLTDKDSFFFVL